MPGTIRLPGNMIFILPAIPYDHKQSNGKTLPLREQYDINPTKNETIKNEGVET